MRGLYRKSVFRIIFERAGWFYIIICYLPDMPFPGSYHFLEYRICPFPVAMPRALFRMTVSEKMNIVSCS
jgi:hypothetical protein